MTQRILTGALLLFVLPNVGTAADPPAQSRPVKHRVTGLFSPDREADLRLVLKDKLPEVRLVSVDFSNSEATFVYDADKLFNRPTPDQLVERFDGLLRSHSLSTFGIRAVLRHTQRTDCNSWRFRSSDSTAKAVASPLTKRSIDWKEWNKPRPASRRVLSRRGSIPRRSTAANWKRPQGAERAAQNASLSVAPHRGMGTAQRQNWHPIVRQVAVPVA